MKYLSPRSDVGFKKLFGNPHHTNLTKSFLNSILDRKEGNLISHVEFTDTQQLPEAADGRTSFFDIYCTDQQGNKFIIEMQRKYQAHFMIRAQYYTSLAFYRQMHTPFKYEKLVPVIFIGILDHILFDDKQDIITRHALMDIKNYTISSHHQMFHIIELPKFTKNIDQLESDIDAWLFFMNNADEYEKIPTAMQNSIQFKEAFEVLERMRWTERELLEYLAEADYAGREDRIEQGAIERGLKQGLKQGIEQGIEQGAYKKGVETAISALNLGLENSVIQQLTGLSVEEIDALSASMKK